jgi:hypothetical protein
MSARREIIMARAKREADFSAFLGVWEVDLG